jgi:hypothetical protein
MRSVYRRNGKTEQIETTIFDPKGAVLRTSTALNNQDRSGLQSDRVGFDGAHSISTHTSLVNKQDGTQEYKEAGSAGNFRHETWVAEKDGHSERIAYNPDGTILKRYRFDRELDSYGNIVKATTSVAIGDSIEFKPTSITYRTFTYYSKEQP